MELGLSGKVAVVGGSSKGIGRAIARELAAEGAHVVINGRHEDALADAERDIIEATGQRPVVIAADLSQTDGADQLVQGAVDAFGTVDVVVTNAGGPPTGGFEDLTDEDFEAGFRLNFLSTVRLIRAALPHLRTGPWGRVVNLQSTAIKEPVPLVTLTNSIRPGVVGLAKELSDQLAPENITVNTVLSGPVLTDRLRYTVRARAEEAGMSEEEQFQEYLKLVPMGRWGRPEEVAALVVFLASERASWLTGTVIQADGGRIRSAL